MKAIVRMTDLDLRDRRVLIREDLNVPMAAGAITSDARIRAALPTLRTALDAGAKVLVMSHLGRPEEGIYDARFSLAPVATRLSELLGREVPLHRDWLSGIECASGGLALCENVRFNKGERKNDEQLSRRMASLCDVFVMDAFATSHRAEASTCGVARFAKVACAGPLLVRELEALDQALTKPARPLVAVVGGSKVSSKLGLLETLLAKVDSLIVGGGIANTFLAASGIEVGKSLHEAETLDMARRLLGHGRAGGGEIVLPSDVVVAKELTATALAETRSVHEVRSDDMIADIGPQTAELYGSLLQSAGTIIWNGPLGVFEHDQFGAGTRAVANAIARSKAFSLAGGGDTVAAIEKYGVRDDISYVSTGGGAFLEFVEGKKLPAVAVLEDRAAEGRPARSSGM